jgi:hypothetical protein
MNMLDSHENKNHRPLLSEQDAFVATLGSALMEATRNPDELSKSKWGRIGNFGLTWGSFLAGFAIFNAIANTWNSRKHSVYDTQPVRFDSSIPSLQVQEFSTKSWAQTVSQQSVQSNTKSV